MTSRHRSEEEVYGAGKINLSVEVAHATLTLPLKWWEQFQSTIMLNSQSSWRSSTSSHKRPHETPEQQSSPSTQDAHDHLLPSDLVFCIYLIFSPSHYKFPQSETLLSTLFTRHQARQHAREGKRKQTVQEMESGKHTCPKNRQVL